MLNPINKTIELADGRTITIETGKLAKQADGSVTVRMGNTVLLATVCAIFLKEGKIMLHATVDDIREREGKSVDALFREIFRAMPMEGGGF